MSSTNNNAAASSTDLELQAALAQLMSQFGLSGSQMSEQITQLEHNRARLAQLQTKRTDLQSQLQALATKQQALQVVINGLNEQKAQSLHQVRTLEGDIAKGYQQFLSWQQSMSIAATN